MAIFGAACADCTFTFEHSSEAATHTVAERHARVRSREVVFGSYAAEPDRPITKQGGGLVTAAARGAVLLGLAVLVLAGCAGGAFDNGGVIRNQYAGDPRFIAIAADLRPAMERVAAAEDYRYPCIWGRCQPILPRLLAEESTTNRRSAGFHRFDNVIVVNLAQLGDKPQWLQRAVAAHEMGHWLLGHASYRPEDNGLVGLVTGKGGGCFENRLACEISANAEAARILTLGWGVPHAEAVEQVYWMLALVSLSRGPDTVNHHDPLVELDAFRRTFGCTDATGATCAGPAGAWRDWPMAPVK